MGGILTYLMPDRSPDLWIITCLAAFPSCPQHTYYPKKQIPLVTTNLSFSLVWFVIEYQTVVFYA